MNRRSRIALEVLAPAPLGLVGLILPVWVHDALTYGLTIPAGRQLVADIGFCVFMAYLIAGIPSLIYALVMERAFRAGVSPASWRAVGISTLLGLLAGLGMVVVPGWNGVRWEVIIPFGGAGLTTGFALGLLIKSWSPADATRGREAGT